MNKIENATLKGVRKALKDSTETDWKKADFDKWAAWATNMNHTIKSNIKVLDELIKLETEDNPKEDKLTL